MKSTALAIVVLAVSGVAPTGPPAPPSSAAVEAPAPAPPRPARSTATSAAIVTIAGVPYVSTTELARLLGASRYWRADTRKLVLRVGDRRLTLTVDLPYVVAGDRTYRLEAPIRSVAGDVHAPLGLLALLPADAAATVIWDEPAHRVRRIGGAATGQPAASAAMVDTSAAPAPERVAAGAPRRLQTIVLDPGHGGVDAGVRAGGLAEKDVVLALARVLQGELERRIGARVVLTRAGDESPGQEQRARTANLARADLVLSLHVDGFPDPRAAGATVWSAPAREAGESAGALDLVPWRDVATRHAAEGRACAVALARALESRGRGPARLRERLVVPLLGVDAPALMIECGTLTSPADRARLDEPGLHELASAIADAVEAWRRGE